MLVTKVIQTSGKKEKIYIDEEFAFALYTGEIRTYKIAEGQELDEIFYEEIITRIQPKRVKLRAMHLLQSHVYTEAGLRQKLRKGDYTEEMIDLALEYVKKYGYVNDTEYARSYILQKQGTLGRKEIERKLLQKGIATQIIQESFLDASCQNDLTDECEAIERWLEKKHFRDVCHDPKAVKRIIGFLCRKGYDFDNIKRVMYL